MRPWLYLPSSIFLHLSCNLWKNKEAKNYFGYAGVVKCILFITWLEHETRRWQKPCDNHWLPLHVEKNHRCWPGAMWLQRPLVAFVDNLTYGSKQLKQQHLESGGDHVHRCPMPGRGVRPRQNYSDRSVHYQELTRYPVNEHPAFPGPCCWSKLDLEGPRPWLVCAKCACVAEYKSGSWNRYPPTINILLIK